MPTTVRGRKQKKNPPVVIIITTIQIFNAIYKIAYFDKLKPIENVTVALH